MEKTMPSSLALLWCWWGRSKEPGLPIPPGSGMWQSSRKLSDSPAVWVVSAETVGETWTFCQPPQAGLLSIPIRGEAVRGGEVVGEEGAGETISLNLYMGRFLVTHAWSWLELTLQRFKTEIQCRVLPEFLYWPLSSPHTKQTKISLHRLWRLTCHWNHIP